MEPDDGFTVTLSSPSAGITLGIASLSSVIGNDEYSTTLTTPGATSFFSIAATNAEFPEGNSGTTAFTFTITRTGTTGDAASVKWVVTGNGPNPISLSDFPNSRLPSGTVAFAGGETNQLITVYVRGDTTKEMNEGFSVVLSTPSTGAGIETASAAGVILNDDSSMYVITASTPTQAEGDTGSTAYTFVVTRTGLISASGSVTWTVGGSGVNPANAADFVGGRLPTGTLRFAAGVSSQTITVYVVGDTTVEANENFAVTLSRPASGGFITAPSVISTITNDDASATVPRAGGIGLAAGIAPDGEASFAFNYTHLGRGAEPSDAAFIAGPSAAADAGPLAVQAGRVADATTELHAQDFVPQYFSQWTIAPAPDAGASGVAFCDVPHPLAWGLPADPRTAWE